MPFLIGNDVKSEYSSYSSRANRILEHEVTQAYFKSSDNRAEKLIREFVAALHDVVDECSSPYLVGVFTSRTASYYLEQIYKANNYKKSGPLFNVFIISCRIIGRDPYQFVNRLDQKLFATQDDSNRIDSPLPKAPGGPR
jgi:hypothetical protein